MQATLAPALSEGRGKILAELGRIPGLAVIADEEGLKPFETDAFIA